VLVGERLIDERPKVFGRLQFRAVGWLVDKPDAVRDGQVFRRVPASIVELKHDNAVAAGAGVACEGIDTANNTSVPQSVVADSTLRGDVMKTALDQKRTLHGPN
jgi:hypothetical protein